MSRKIQSMVVYGHPGAGKTMAVAKAMPRALWVVTKRSNLSGYHDWIEKHPEEAAEKNLHHIPNNHILEVKSKKFDPETKQIVPVSNLSTINQVVAEYSMRVLNATEEKPCPWDGIVFDEFSIFAKRVFEEMGSQNKNGFAVIRELKEWIGTIAEIPNITEKPMALVCHAQDPKYHDESANAAGLKYKGGPAMPVGTVIAELCAAADGVLQAIVEADPFDEFKINRFLATEIHPEWERKIRLSDIPPKLDGLDLRELLQQAGW